MTQRIPIISPMIGKPTDKPNRPQGDLCVQACRYVDLLLAYPSVCKHPDFGTVYVAHPLTFIIQKLLIRKERRAKGRHKKDQYDLFCTLWNFNAIWSEWKELLVDICKRDKTWNAWIKNFRLQFQQLYLSDEPEAIRDILDFSKTSNERLITAVAKQFNDVVLAV